MLIGCLEVLGQYLPVDHVVYGVNRLFIGVKRHDKGVK